jgi:hypothetical protein
MNFTGAGCFFFNDLYCLAGYQPRKQKPSLSGLGGKREGEEDYFQTALRETLEELFELQTVPREWIETIHANLNHKGILKNGEYIIVLYSFDDLQRILEILHENNCASPLYEEFPTNLLDLLFNRKQLESPPEISHLSLLPLVHHPSEIPFVAPHFLKDIRLYLKNKLLIQPS